MNTINETEVRIVASPKSWMEGEAVRQIYATARLDGVRLAVGFPDLHPGGGTPVGAAFVTADVIYPHIIGGDIGCGMALFKTDLSRRNSSRVDRWAQAPFRLEHPWDEDVSAYLAEQNLESTNFDSAMGTIGGGNHFAELQLVERILDAGEFKRIGIGRGDVVALIHSGSRGLGQAVLRDYVDERQDNGALPDSTAAQTYLREHDFAVRWATADPPGSETVRLGRALQFARAKRPLGHLTCKTWEIHSPFAD